MMISFFAIFILHFPSFLVKCISLRKMAQVEQMAVDLAEIGFNGEKQRE